MTDENNNQHNTSPKQTPQQESAELPRWSWGAFMFDPVFLIATRKYAWLLLYVLMFVPILNFVAAIGIKVFLGLKGHSFAAESTSFENEEQRKGFMTAFDHAGLIIFCITVAVILIGLLFSAAFAGSFFGALMHGMPGIPGDMPGPSSF